MKRTRVSLRQLVRPGRVVPPSGAANESAAPAPDVTGRTQTVTCLICDAVAHLPAPRTGESLGFPGTPADRWKLVHSRVSHQGRHFYRTERIA